MKTQQECWEALIAGEVLVDERDDQELRLVNGFVCELDKQVGQPFINPEHWSIKPKTLPFVEAFRALVGHECSKIVNGSKTICVHNVMDKLMPSDLDTEWELVK